MRGLVCCTALSMLLSLGLTGISHGASGRIEILEYPQLPRVVDGEKEKAITVTGKLEGGPFSDVRIVSLWAKNQSLYQSLSPILTPEGDSVKYFKHSFPVGGANCGLVRFHAVGRISDVSISSQDEYSYVDCEPPRLTMVKPKEGEILKPGKPLQIEFEINDDSLEYGKYGVMSSVLSGKTYAVAIDVDGQNVKSANYEIFQFGNNRRLFQLPGLGKGRHAIRVTLADPTGKTDEKTIFINVDGTSPSVNFVSHYSGQQVVIPAGGVASMKVSVEVTDPGEISSGIEKVEFYVDGKGVGVANAPSDGRTYSVTFGVPDQGRREILVKAFDKVGNTSSRSIGVTVVHEGKAKTIGPVPGTQKTLPSGKKGF